MKKMIIILVLILLVLLSLILKKKQNEETNQQISCYDYIVETMSLPEYWDEYQPLHYSTEQLKKEAETNLVHGTGWKLVDEEDAVFERGNQSVLRINFKDFTAENQIEKNYLEADVSYIQSYDFNSKSVQRVYGSESYDVSQYFESSEEYLLNPKDEIQRTMEQYEKKFSQVGCPILKQETGILEEYKTKMIEKPQREIEEFTLDENVPLFELAEAKDILEIQIKEDEPVLVQRGDTFIPIGYYAPVFLFIEKESTGSSYFENLNHSLDTMSDFVEGMITPALNNIFDETRVYKVKSNQYVTNELHYGMDIESFKKGVSVPTDTLLVIYWQDGIPQIGMTYYLDSNLSKLKECIDYVNDLAEHYQKNVYISDQNLKKFELRHNLGWQRLLGLR